MFVVAGATGKVGSKVVDALIAAGKPVRAVVRDAQKGAALQARGAEVAVASLDDARALARALDGADGFFAILPEDPTSERFHEGRAQMADAIASAVSESRVPHVVFLSTVAASLSEGNGPARDLHYAENALRATGALVTVARSSYFQENVAMALAPARMDGIYRCFLPSADASFPTAATKDVAAFVARSLLAPPPRSTIVDLIGPAYTTRQLAERLGAVLGKSLRVVEIPPPAQIDVLLGAGLSRAFAEALAEMNACVAAGRVVPRGDRTEPLTTTIDAVLPQVVPS